MGAGEGFASTFPKSYVIPMKVRPAESDVGILRAALRQRARAVTSLEVKARAAGLLSEHQHITDVRLFKRVKKSLGIKSLRVGFGARSQWLWELPGRDDDAREQDAAPRPQLPIDWVEGVARLDPDRPLNDVPRHRWRQFVADFLSSPDSLAELAARLGWDAMALFGCAPKRPLDYSGCAGLLWASSGSAPRMRLSRCARLVASPFLTWFSHRDTPARVGTVRFASQSSYFVVGAVGVQQVCLLGIDPPDASECCKSVQSELTVCN